MKTALRNFINTLVRFRTATLLNLLGLAVAFASFLVIMMPVRHELTYDGLYPTKDRLYRIELKAGKGNFTRSLADEAIAAIPQIDQVAYVSSWKENGPVSQPGQSAEHAFEATWVTASGQFPAVFGLRAVAGSFADFNHGKSVIIPRTMARRLFGSENPSGEQLVLKTAWSADTVSVAAVYADLPENSSLKGIFFKNIGDEGLQSRNWNYSLYATLRDKADIAPVTATLDGLLKRRTETTPWLAENRTVGPDEALVALIKPNKRYFSEENPDAKKGDMGMVLTLVGLAALILGLAVINFINFSMALVPKRIRNINTRKVLGSTNAALRWQQVGEAMGLCLLAASLGLVLVDSLSTTSFAALVPASLALGANLPLVWITLGIALLTGLLSALYPALYSTSFSPALVLKGSFGLSEQGRKLRTALIGVQYVISVGLIIVAIFIRVQYDYMRSYDIGIDRGGVISAELSQKLTRQYKTVQDQLLENPDIQGVAFSMQPVISSGFGWTRPYMDTEIKFNTIHVTPGFLTLMGIPVPEGRDFREGDPARGGAYIFNETARKAFGLEVGEYVGGNQEEHPTEIVGIARDYNFRPLHYAVEPFAFYVRGDDYPAARFLYFKTQPGREQAGMQYVEQTLLAMDPEIRSTLALSFVDESVGAQYGTEDNLSRLISAFSLLAVLISTMGAFGLILFETQYRRKEIGLRKVFGATVADVLNMFNRRYVGIVGVCFVIAVPLAYYVVKQWQGNFAYQAPVSLWVFAAALAIVLIITVTTVTLQSYRAATENPAESLKSE